VQLISGDSVEVSPYWIVEIDTEMISEYNFGAFTDPYNTLSGCVLFDISPPSLEVSIETYETVGNYYIGVYKGNEIIRLSDSYSQNIFSYSGSYFAAMDLNNDAKVEIIHSWTETDIKGKEVEQSLNIISWDGNTGSFINDGGINTNLKNEGHYDIFDLNNDGLFEIASET
jgi:hypothetical protein